MDLYNKEEVKKAIEEGIHCFYRFGFAFRGAGKRLITKEKALELLPRYSPGAGFYELAEEPEGIIFNEYSANDMW